ncbi:hypothetical protein ACX80D_16610 [Arthrobacter sp. Sr24]
MKQAYPHLVDASSKKLSCGTVPMADDVNIDAAGKATMADGYLSNIEPRPSHRANRST